MKIPNNVLFISHKDRNCGVHEFGKNIGKILKRSKKYRFIYVECDSHKNLNEFVKKYSPICMIYNYQGAVMPWLNAMITTNYRVPQIGMIHEVSQEICDRVNNYLFDAYIAPDPTLILKNPIVYKTGRLLLNNKLKHVSNKVPVIGSFGFASYNKHFDVLVRKVCEEFDEAIIRLNIPFAKFGDQDGNKAKKVITKCQSIVQKYPKISFEYSHEYLSNTKLLNFLNSNTINAFLYSDNHSRGISSVIDFALSVKVPIAISSPKNTDMFRHIQNTHPSIVYSSQNNFKDIIKNGTKPLEDFYLEWTEDNLIWDYERTVTDVLKKSQGKNRNGFWVRSAINFLKRQVYGPPSPSTNNWSSEISNYKDNILSMKKHARTNQIRMIEGKSKLNRILDDSARESYNLIIKALYRILPTWMKRKNSRANIQQAFVLDTVIRHVKDISKSQILSVGCFEDTAFAALKMLGYKIIGIDPVLNYDLDTFITKPSTKRNSFDIIFSTSVIEHVEDDLKFLKNIQSLVKKGGYIVFTCDFKEGYKEGDSKPGCDYRFYTKEHLNNLVDKLEECILVDNPSWDCPNPDFQGGNDLYTFASVVLKKV